MLVHSHKNSAGHQIPPILPELPVSENKGYAIVVPICLPVDLPHFPLDLPHSSLPLPLESKYLATGFFNPAISSLPC